MRKGFINMNRLVIIGNGFDLAHGLPTSYKDFMNDYWRNVIQVLKNKDIYDDDLLSLKINITSIGIQSRNEFTKDVKCYKTLKQFTEKNIKYCSKEFKNQFFLYLSDVAIIENWVDIENIYYGILKEKGKGVLFKYNYPWDVSQLNKEFEEVKNLLEKYLQDEVVNKYNLDFTKNQNINLLKVYNFLKPISLLSNEENILKEFISIDDVNEIKEHFEKERKEELVNNLYFLNFNYTPITSIYRELLGKDDKIETRMNFIHGSLGNVSENKINFGFGDEMDDEYKSIENLNNNEYLKNFKSFQYLQNSNYNDLLRYIDNDKFQVFIIGHSCGLSDRTLLNTIFEHNNCRSIKVFYHQKENGTDNYTEIIQNISRHFNKKKLMREKIVNKTLCQPLPQIQLPLK
ncbi:AbiH family protein [Flavobacterium petrolei]|uniref:AbiH family protein n=1 Tax=Flavobacterium petrolei TaxID=2259594 RepID=UPI0037575434